MKSRKGNILLVTIALCSFLITVPAKSQSYDPSDSLALLAIDSACDALDSLNWNTEADPGNWDGVTWNSENPRRVVSLSLYNKALVGTMDVSDLSNLEWFACEYNQLTALDVSGNLKLTGFCCQFNQLTNLNVTGLINIEQLRCSNNQLSDLDISTLINLNCLECANNQLTTLDLTNNVNLITLVCSYNPLIGIDLSSLLKLETLYCSGINLTNLDLSIFPNLGILYCFDNKITTLDISAATKLRDLFCFNNQLTSLNVSTLENLQILECSNNLLSDLNVSGFSNLRILICGYNQLDTIDCSGLKALDYLQCKNNQLTSLNVSGDINLGSLICSNNLLTSLDLSGLTNLKELDCSNNPMSNLNASNLTNLDTLNCSSNKLPFSSLATGSNAKVFIYNSQDTIFNSDNILNDTNINYSSEALIQNISTQFVFEKNGVSAESNTTGLFATKGNGVYHCEMTNAKFPGLTLITAPVTITGVVDINDPILEGFKIYPNPIKDHLYISQPELIEQYTLYSQTGSILKKSKKYNWNIDFTGFPAGVYFLSITSKGQRGVYKVVKE